MSEIPDPLPLRCIPVPAEVTSVQGCDCGGLTFHRTDCSLFSLPPDQARAAVHAAEDREAAWGSALNERLRAALAAYANP
jgi:hypothetical protein